MSKLIRFIRDVSSHQLSVIRDDGLYRHLRFSRPNTRAYSFDIVTWPGYMTVTGDMGTWTFSRITDMFEFFTSEHFGVRDSFLINPGYWSEKFEAGAGRGRQESPCFEYDHASFCAGLLRWQNDYLDVDEDADPEEETDWDDDAHEDSDEARIREIVRCLTREGYSNEHEAYRAIDDADWPDSVSTWDISEGITFKTYSHHYVWICYAIVWGIERYNTQKLVARAMDTFLSFLPVHAAAREVVSG